MFPFCRKSRSGCQLSRFEPSRFSLKSRCSIPVPPKKVSKNAPFLQKIGVREPLEQVEYPLSHYLSPMLNSNPT